MRYDSYEHVPLDDMVNRKIVRVEKTSDRIDFHTECGKHFVMFHQQDCCESVYIDAIDGDLQQLVGGVIRYAEVNTNSDTSREYDSVTWTFYRIRSEHEFIHITWRGSSNGYYSERVSFVRVLSKEERTQRYNERGW
ncbi:hypothetical protein [Xanthomonas phage BUDD]|nr:hypothetical protein [Xanthomonas phage BUDD]